MIDDLGPGARGAYNRLMVSCADLDTARRRIANTSVASGIKNRMVTAELLARLASSPRASSPLRDFAARVADGEYSWDQVDSAVEPVPPEVDELKADPEVTWPSEWPLTPPTSDGPYRIPWQ